MLCYADNGWVGKRLCDECGCDFQNARYYIPHSGSRFSNQSEKWYHIICYCQSRKVKRRPQCTYQLKYAKRGSTNSHGYSFVRTDDFPSLDEQTKSVLYQYLFPFVVLPPGRRPLLTLPKDIDEMTEGELRVELKKRDLYRREKKWELVAMLKEYFCDRAVRSIRSKHVAMGYCRRMEGLRYKMNIPIYLKQIVIDYLGADIDIELRM